MNARAEPCPFCGYELTPVYGGQKQLIAFQHEHSDCFRGGCTIGIMQIERWNRRVSGIHYEILDQRPVFNETGTGQSASAHFINSVVEYYRLYNRATADNK